MISGQQSNLQNTVAHSCHNSSSSITNSFCCIQIPQHHHWTSNLQLELCKWQSRAVDSVKIFHRIHQFSTFTIAFDRVCTHKNFLFSRKLIQHLLIDLINISVSTCEDSAVCKVFIRRKRKLGDSRIDGFDQRVESIFWALEMIGKSDGSSLLGVLAMSNLQLPLCKCFFSLNMSV